MKDFRNNQLEVGSLVVHASRHGSRLSLKEGIVVGFDNFKDDDIKQPTVCLVEFYPDVRPSRITRSDHLIIVSES